MSAYRKIVASALIFGTVVSPALADNRYGVFDIGPVYAVDACNGLDPEVKGCKDVATLVRIGGGYQFTPMWGAEVAYAQSGSSRAGMILGTSVYWQVRGLQLSGIGTFPIEYPLLSKLWGSLSGNVSFLTKLGVARTELRLSGGYSARATTTKLMYGIGAQYDSNKRYSARVLIEDWGIAGNDSTGTSRIGLISVGVIYKY
ncbi:MAG: outer membrane beta-barrel protein [Gallionella sp.]